MVKQRVSINSAKDSAVVIGAGPAGCIAAIKLASLGVRTTLVDRRPFPRGKVCGGCLARSGVRLLRSLGLDERVGVEAAPLVRTAVLHHADRSCSIPIPGYRIIDRGAFDMALTELAVDRGATFQPGTTARVLEDDRVVLTRGAKSWCVSGGAVVVADGLAGSSLKDRPEFAWRVNTRSPIGIGTIIEASPSLRDDAVSMVFGQRSYIGIVRLDLARWIVAGAVAPELVQQQGVLGSARSILGERLALDLRLDEADWHGCPRVTRKRAASANGLVLVAGDASGYVEPVTGEGITWAMQQGLRCAHLAAKRLDAPRHLAASRSPSQRRDQRVRGHRRGLCSLTARLSRNTDLMRHVIGAFDRAPGLGRAGSRLVWGSV